MTNEIIFVHQDMKLEIEQLRKKEYQKAKGFNVDLTTLNWKTSDDDSYVMAAKKNNKYVATMRGEVIQDIKLLEKKIECSWNFPFQIDMPVLLLSRAATCSSQRTTGLNLILRYWFLRLAIHHQIPFVVGTFISGSPREKSLGEMGYQFFNNTLGWQQSTYRSEGEVKVAVLDLLKHSDKALHYCRERFSKEIEEFKFKNCFPDLKYVRDL